MAYQITGPKFGHFLSPADTIKEIADKETTAAFAELGRPVRYAFVRIYVKAFSETTAVTPTQYVVEAASNVAFNADLVSAGMAVIDDTDEGAAFIICYSPLKALAFWRIRPVYSGDGASTFDAEIAGAG